MEEIDHKNSLNENISNNNDIRSAKKSPTEEDFSNRQKMKHHTDKNDKDNSDDFDEDDEDSMTEITNEEYLAKVKDIVERICDVLIENKKNVDDYKNVYDINFVGDSDFSFIIKLLTSLEH